jgi:hypothetical protein
MRNHFLLSCAIAAGVYPAYSQNYLHTSGNQILDSGNHVVRLTGVSWFGFETSTFCPQGLWARSMSSMLDQIKSTGFNVIRVPYTLNPGWAVPVGTNWLVGSQYNSGGPSARTTSQDTFTVIYTANGTTQTLNGHF